MKKKNGGPKRQNS
jgi:hypothetical protein